ncbi:hypothetical protein BGW41_004047 [Actinomortierella wolfii]|nr:hypothetical protein BGW41_004047 [Actinomortierella wolfii]
MNIFKTVGKIIWGDSANAELFQIPSGQFYVYKPTTLPGKTTKECIYIDSMVTVRRTAVDFHYTLSVSRVYEEGEDENDDPEADDTDRFFPIHENMKLRKYVSNGATAFSWQGQEPGDENFVYEFVCDGETSSVTCNTFETLIYQCMYEAKYHRSHLRATDAEIAQFEIQPGEKIVSAGSKKSASSSRQSSPAIKNEKASPSEKPAQRPDVGDQPITYEGVAEAEGELHLYNSQTSLFEIQAEHVVVQIVRSSKFEYWLLVNGKKGEQYLAQPLEERMNPIFSPSHMSFIWNYYDDKANIYSWLIRFADDKKMQLFKIQFAECMYEVINLRPWGASESSDQMYHVKSYDDPDVVMTSASESESNDDSGDDYSDYEEEESEEDRRVSFGADNDTSKNSHLQVGYKDRSFVSRGSKIGVFRHTDDDSLEFDTTINRVVNSAGKDVNPSMMLLHDQDTSMVLLDPTDQDTAYRMDLEYGKIVEEWNLEGTSGVNTILGDAKYAHLHGTNTMIGMSKNAIFRIDPRLSGNKIVQSEFKQYAKNNDFTAAATTANGSLAIGGSTGEIKLYNELGKVAKTNLPGIGNPIIGIDVTGNGRYVLATCKTYLLLIDVLDKESKKLFFDKRFPVEKKPTPVRLQLKPQDVALMNHEISFTPAKFNMGENEEEKTIVTSTGPYVITWNFRRVKLGHVNEYQIKQYNDNVVADNFKYGHDRSIIVTLPDDGTYRSFTTPDGDAENCIHAGK